MDVDPFYEQVMPAVATVRRLAEAGKQLRGLDRPSVPSERSIAMADLAAESRFCGAWGTDPVRHVHSLTGVLTAAAEDHALSMCRLLEGGDPVPTYAFVTLARAALEQLGRAWTLCATDCDVSRRIARGKNETLYSIYWLAQLPAEVYNGDVAARRASIYETAGALGWECGDGWVLERRASMTAIVGHAIGSADAGRAVYNYYSAVSHGTQYGLASSYDPRTAEETVAGGLTLTQVTTAEAVASCFGTVGGALWRAGEQRRAYMGWPGDGWTDAGWLDALSGLRELVEALWHPTK